MRAASGSLPRDRSRTGHALPGLEDGVLAAACLRQEAAYPSIMPARIDEHDGSAADGSSVERGYEAWKRTKIERALVESRDRASMIPIEQLWRHLPLER